MISQRVIRGGLLGLGAAIALGLILYGALMPRPAHAQATQTPGEQACRSSLKVERDGHDGDLTTAFTLNSQLLTTIKERDDLKKERDDLTKERDSLKADKDLLTAQLQSKGTEVIHPLRPMLPPPPAPPPGSVDPPGM